jgi:hypothetical protein
MPVAENNMFHQAGKTSGTRLAATGGVRQRYNTAKRKRDKEQSELQDLLVDPQYDALFDGIGMQNLCILLLMSCFTARSFPNCMFAYLSKAAR